MKQKKFLLSAVIFLLMMNMNAQPGTIDPTFNPADSGFWKGNSLKGPVTASFVQKDEKFIIAGNFLKFNETKAPHIIRFNTDGTIDPTFNGVTTGAFNIQKIVSQTDGKLFIVGAFQDYNSITRNGIARLNADGSLDSTFNPGTGISIYSLNNQAMVLQNDGKIIVGGGFKSFNGATVGNIVRINPDGKEDATFYTGTGFNYFVYSIALQSDGKIIVGGEFTEYNTVSNSFIIRLNPDGSPDNTFKKGTGPDSKVSEILLQDDGKIVITGEFKNYNGSARNGIARLNPDGSLDNTFNVTPGAFTGILSKTCKQTDGKIIVAEAIAAARGSQGRLVRLNANGSVDNGFNIPVTNGNVSTFFPQSDGKIIVGGEFTKCNGVLRNYITRLYAEGTIDKSVFNVVGKGVNGYVWASDIQNDGKILIGGSFASYNGTHQENIARLHIDGSLDTTFHAGTGTDEAVESVTIQPDGKILIGGWFSKYKGILCGGLARLNIDGTPDNSFKANPGFNGHIESISVQPDGKIIASGDFMTYNGKAANNIIRLQPDGSVDTTFKPVTEGYEEIWTNLLQPDGKIILGGYFRIVDGTNEIRNIARLNADGSVDTSFHCGKGTDNYIYALRLQKDGKIIIGGRFKTYNGLTTNQVARLNANGTLDKTFSSGLGIGSNGNILTIAIQDNGKIIVGGGYSSFNGTVANSLVCLNSDGSLDNAFKNTSGATNKTILTSNIQQDGKIIIGGNFTDYDGTGRNNIARVNGSELINIDENIKYNNTLVIYPNPTNGEFTIMVEQIGKFSIFDNLGKLVFEKKLNSNKETINLTNVNNGIYFFKIDTENGQITKKIIISK